ncbi:hypothetical protein [Salibacterium lacus]|uniref:Uncharacterized protein n=1 Tax=Salibacterium lacus TaxID=1898109 RepID=A0ABW5T4Q8_9BACI
MIDPSVKDVLTFEEDQTWRTSVENITLYQIGEDEGIQYEKGNISYDQATPGQLDLEAQGNPEASSWEEVHPYLEADQEEDLDLPVLFIVIEASGYEDAVVWIEGESLPDSDPMDPAYITVSSEDNRIYFENENDRIGVLSIYKEENQSDRDGYITFDENSETASWVTKDEIQEGDEFWISITETDKAESDKIIVTAE